MRRDRSSRGSVGNLASRGPDRARVSPASVPSSSARLLPVLVLFALLVPALPAAADPAYEGPLLYGLDPVLRTTRDPRLLGVERLVLRHRLEAFGVEPTVPGRDRPDLRLSIRRSWLERARVDLERVERLVEFDGPRDLFVEIEYPRFLPLFPSRETLPGGFVIYPPRRLDDPDVQLFVDDIAGAMARRHDVTRRVERLESLDLAGGGRRVQDAGGLINLTIPIKLPRTLERIIGRGEKTNIRISGRERIAITGESTVTKPFLGDERIQSQSLFPSLDMEQELQVNLSGTIGEKIILEVDHNSAQIGPDATKIKLMYQGDEDDIIQTIQTGDVGLTLPGGTLLGYTSSKTGLFGIKVTGQVGPADFTVLATKQKAESSQQSFNAKGGQITQHQILSHAYYRNRFFRLTSDKEQFRIPMNDIDPNSVRIYKRLPGGELVGEQIENVAVYSDVSGRWDMNFAATNPAFRGDRWEPVPIDTDESSPGYSLLVDEQNVWWGVDLNSDQGDGTILAVTFNTENFGRVGDDPGGPGSTIFEDGVAVDGEWIRMKLLKAPATEADSMAHALMIRQIYGLGGAGIDAGSFGLRIERVDAGTDTPQYDENGVSYLQIFGLDEGDDYGVGVRDEEPDLRRGTLFNLKKGLLMFPESFPQPFAADSSAYLANAANTEFVWDPESFLATNLVPNLYRAGESVGNFPQYSKFRLVAEHASASNTINLGSSNIEEGSEVVKVDGKTLTRGQDYDVDYTFGEITLKEGNFTLTAESQISVSYQYSPFAGGGSTSLLGANLGYELGRDSRVSTTWLYQTEAIVGEKAKLGEEPSKNLVGTVNMTHTMRPGILTDVANLLSRHDTEKESTLQFSGELAMSIPNPNTKGQVYLEDFEGIDASDIVSLVRPAWTLPSFPVHDGGGNADPDTAFTPVNRVNTIRWFRPKDKTPRWYLNPDLVNQERDEAQNVMELYLAEDADRTWSPEAWGGIMRGVSSFGLDLTQAQFVELWLNDGEIDPAFRTGRLHIDFGEISEDGYWPGGEVGTEQDEDANNNGLFEQVSPDEDTGLGGITDALERNNIYDENTRTYPRINSTKKNGEHDREDANNNGFFDTDNQYFTVTIDLADTEAEVDVLRDYGSNSELEANRQAWRKYRIPLSEIVPVTLDETQQPDLLNIKHVRVWFEDPERTDREVRLQLSELKFLGSRWERNGIRRVADETILGDGDLLPDEGFFLGEVNNKENPDYVPPYKPHEELNIAEKEQALVIDFNDLAQGHQLTTSRQVALQGDDYTGYEELGWFWNNVDHRNADLDLFFRVGADSLNYYELAYRFAEGRNKTGWKSMLVNLVELSNVKNGELREDGARHGTVRDTRSGENYAVRVVGRPDLRRIKRYFFVVANNALSEPAAGRLYLNDIRLLGVKRNMGTAERGGVRLNMADVFKLDFDWSHRDQEFHGLNAKQGSGIDSKDWNLSMNFSVQDFVPLLGFRLPVGLSRRQGIQRPKYELNSDIEIIDPDVRNELSTIETSEGFSVRLTHPGSKNAILRYALDPWAFNLNGSRGWRQDPLSRGHNKTLQGGLKYDLRIAGRYRLGAYPLLNKVPLLKSLVIVPKNVSLSSGFTSTYRQGTTITAEGDEIVRPPSRTRPLNLDANVDYAPLTVLDIHAAGRSERDLLREARKFGVNIGQENRRTYSTRLTIKPPRAKELPTGRYAAPLRAAAKALSDLRPSIQFKGGFSDNHGPEVRQGDDPPGTRTVGNNGLWEFRFSLPVADVAKKFFPKRRYSQQQREQIVAAAEARRTQRGRQGAEDSTLVLTPEETAGLTPEEINELREERLLEAAARQEEEEAERRGRPTPAASQGGSGDPMQYVLEALRNMTPVKFTFTDKKSSQYARYRADVPFWYRTGLLSVLDRADSLYATYSQSTTNTLNIATNTKLHRNVSVDLKFNEAWGENERTNSATKNFKQDWPDVRVSLSGLERWPLFGGREDREESWFQTSSFTVSYRRSRFANGSTPTYYTPTTQTSMAPRWSGTLRNGMTITTSVTMTKDRKVSLGSVTENSGLSVGLQLRHQFRAQSFLARLGLYRPGNNPTVNMDVDITYGRDRNTRTVGSQSLPAVSGLNRLSVNPRFSYNITRNLSGALRFIYSRNANVQSGQTTTTLGMGLEATFVF